MRTGQMKDRRDTLSWLEAADIVIYAILGLALFIFVSYEVGSVLAKSKSHWPLIAYSVAAIVVVARSLYDLKKRTFSFASRLFVSGWLCSVVVVVITELL